MRRFERALVIVFTSIAILWLAGAVAMVAVKVLW
jgi:hypothetical protein